MAVFVVGLVFSLALAGFSDANYCVCNSGLSDNVLQKNIDYACGAGADCSPLLQNGPCFNPNTVKDHCNYAVNSYYQRKGNIQGSCDFQGTATVTPNPPSTGSGCVFPSSPGNAGGTTPTTNPTTGGTPTTPGTPTVGGTPTTPGTPTVGGTPTTPGTPTVGGTPTTPNVGGTPTTPGSFPGTGTGTGTGTTNPGTVPGSPLTPGFGLAPTGSGFSNTDSSSAGVKLLTHDRIITLVSIAIILISAVFCPMI